MQAKLPLFITPPDGSLLYDGFYDPILVGASIAVAFFASYTALLVARHAMQTSVATTRRKWIVVGGLCLGLGIWAMHFVGMLAFSLPCTTNYDAVLTLLSMLPGIGASLLTMSLLSRPSLSLAQLLLGGLALGLGIGSMHYAGMSALRLDGLVRYDLKLFLLSIALAVALATLALWTRSRLQHLAGRWSHWTETLGAGVIALAVSGMHYTAMTAAYFVRDDSPGAVSNQIGPTFLAIMILIATSAIVFMTLVANFVARPTLLTVTPSYKVVAILIAGWCAVSWLGVNRYFSQSTLELFEEAQQASQQKIETLALNIEETLRNIKGIPQVFSEHEGVRRALLATRTDTAAEAVRELNQSLQTIATHLPIDVIWVMDRTGNTIAASNHDQPDSFVGSNFGARQYFQDALLGHRGQQYAVGLVSKVPGLYYSYPVLDAGRTIGVIAVKRNVSNFFNLIKQVDAFASDANGVVILSANPHFELRALPQARVKDMTEQQLKIQYKQTEFPPLHLEPWGDERMPEAYSVDGARLPSIVQARPLADGMLKVHIIRELRETERLQSQQHWVFLLLAAAGSLFIITTSSIVLYLRETQKVEADLRIAATAFEAQESIMITDPIGKILRVNGAFTRVTGYEPEEAIGQNVNILRSSHHPPAFYRDMWTTAQRTGSWQGEIWDRRKNGEVYPCWLNLTAVRDKEDRTTHFVAMHTDITQRKAAEEEIANLAYYDPLTQLPNRRLLLERLRQALANCLRQGKLGALLFIDLDNFKTLNDTLGHDKGDLLLREVANRLHTCLREGDTVARLGGDEFVVMLEGLHSPQDHAASEARTVSEKIIAVLNQPYRLASYNSHSTPSIGIALFGSDSDTTDEILKRADLAMYQAKAAGRNTLRFFDPDMQASVNARAALEASLREALQDNQFVLHYQVQVNAAGQVSGVEALVRWLHPRDGMVPPDHFIALAEDTGLILPLGQWVLKAACRQLAAWAADAATAHLKLAVNVSARQFHHPDFVRQVMTALEESGANPHRLRLELTESLLLADIDDTIAKMELLKRQGIGFSLDDFGTGYSSLSYLKQLPLDELKIDRSFVRDIFTDSNDATIVRTIIGLASSLGLDVIAEGVESETQREFLAQQGCRIYQGYLFGQPVPAESLVLNSSTTGA